ncbi:ribosome silencing factor [Alphaproteobacteria bacterium LSUCC0684]
MKERTISAGQTAESSILLDLVLTSLDKDKAQDITTIPLAGKSTIADYMVIASGSSSRQLMAMADHLERNLKENGKRPMGSEGGNTGDWILIDAGDVIVHLFRPEVREFYQLEKMWSDHASGETVTIQSATI